MYLTSLVTSKVETLKKIEGGLVNVYVNLINLFTSPSPTGVCNGAQSAVENISEPESITYTTNLDCSKLFLF